MHYAAQEGLLDAGKELLDAGADASAVGEAGDSPLHIGTDCGAGCTQVA